MYILFNLIPRLAKVFSGSSVWRQIKLLVELWYFALTRKTFLRGRPMTFQFVYLHRPLQLTIHSIVDLAALSEVFLLEEYVWCPIEDPKVIIDLGAHFGDTALYYHCRYPQAKIIAVEPAPDTFERLRQNVEHIPEITAVNMGISNINGTAELNMVQSSLGNSFTKRSTATSVVSVPVCTLQALLAKQGIPRADLIKFDIEGAEELLFSNNAPEEFADAYIGEVHSDLISTDPETFVAAFNEYRIEKEALSNPNRFILKATRT